MCISLRISDLDNLFIYLLSFNIPSLKKCYLSSWFKFVAFFFFFCLMELGICCGITTLKLSMHLLYSSLLNLLGSFKYVLSVLIFSFPHAMSSRVYKASVWQLLLFFFSCLLLHVLLFPYLLIDLFGSLVRLCFCFFVHFCNFWWALWTSQTASSPRLASNWKDSQE